MTHTVKKKMIEEITITCKALMGRMGNWNGPYIVGNLSLILLF